MTMPQLYGGGLAPEKIDDVAEAIHALRVEVAQLRNEVASVRFSAVQPDAVTVAPYREPGGYGGGTWI